MIWRFTVSTTLPDATTCEIQGLITPPVEAASFWEALKTDEVKNFCEENKCTVYGIVGR